MGGSNTARFNGRYGVMAMGRLDSTAEHVGTGTFHNGTSLGLVGGTHVFTRIATFCTQGEADEILLVLALFFHIDIGEEVFYTVIFQHVNVKTVYRRVNSGFATNAFEYVSHLGLFLLQKNGMCILN